MTVLQRTDLTTSQKIQCAAAAVAGQHAPAAGERTLLRNEPQFGTPNRISCDRTARQFAYRSIWPPPANNPY